MRLRILMRFIDLRNCIICNLCDVLHCVRVEVTQFHFKFINIQVFDKLLLYGPTDSVLAETVTRTRMPAEGHYQLFSPWQGNSGTVQDVKF